MTYPHSIYVSARLIILFLYTKYHYSQDLGPLGSLMMVMSKGKEVYSSRIFGCNGKGSKPVRSLNFFVVAHAIIAIVQL